MSQTDKIERVLKHGRINNNGLLMLALGEILSQIPEKTSFTRALSRELLIRGDYDYVIEESNKLP